MKCPDTYTAGLIEVRCGNLSIMSIECGLLCERMSWLTHVGGRGGDGEAAINLFDH